MIIKGYTETGTVDAVDGEDDRETVAVTAMTWRDVQSGGEGMGVVVESVDYERYTYGEVSRERSRSRSYVDYDEIAGLISGIEYVAKADNRVTKLKHFEAIYATRGDLTVTVFNDGRGNRQAAVRCGTIGPATAYLNLGELEEFKRMVVSAKDTLDKSH